MRIAAKLRYALLPLLVTFFLGAAEAAAEIPVDQLLGTWKGQMIMTMDDTTETVSTTMTFTADGKLIVSQESGPEEETSYQIEGDTVLLKDPEGKGNDLLLKRLVLDETTLEADLATAGMEQLPPGFSFRIELKRQ